jgi:hypothetical protein
MGIGSGGDQAMGARRGGRSRPDGSGIGGLILDRPTGRSSPDAGVTKGAGGRFEDSIEGVRVEDEEGDSSEQGRGRKDGAVDFGAIAGSASDLTVGCQPAVMPRIGRSGEWQLSALPRRTGANTTMRTR